VLRANDRISEAQKCSPRTRDNFDANEGCHLKDGVGHGCKVKWWGKCSSVVVGPAYRNSDSRVLMTAQGSFLSIPNMQVLSEIRWNLEASLSHKSRIMERQ
jgi:hypothetical protein